MAAARKIRPVLAGQSKISERARLSTKERVEAANVDFLTRVLRQKPDKNCWTAQAIVSSALGRAKEGEKFTRGRAKGAVGPWQALANEYAARCETFGDFVHAIERDNRVDEIADEALYLSTGKKITKKSLRNCFSKARLKCAKRG